MNLYVQVYFERQTLESRITYSSRILSLFCCSQRSIYNRYITNIDQVTLLETHVLLKLGLTLNILAPKHSRQSFILL